MLEIFAITLIATVVMQVLPGPNLIAVASTSLASGRKAGVIVALGVASGAFCWALGVAAGLGVVLERYPSAILGMKLIGGSYLLYLGLRSALSIRNGASISIRADKHKLSPVQAWRRGVLVVLTNPKAALMWAAMAGIMFGAGLHALEVALFAPIGAASAAVIYGIYAVLFSTSVIDRTYHRFWRVIEGLFGATFGALGGKLLYDGFRELRG